jgi:hypothetical protein
MAASTAGYSGTPLARKLGMAAGSRVVVLNAPDGYRDWLAPMPAGVRFEAKVSAATDVVHVFVDRRSEMTTQLEALRARIAPSAAVWVSWPKKASRVPTDIAEDTIREVALPLGFVDVKVCAVSEVWSGLKLVIRKELRGAPA